MYDRHKRLYKMLNIGKKIGKIPKSEAEIEEAKVKKRRN